MTNIANQNTDPNRVIIFDTTNRDGNQALRRTMTPEKKLTIAKQLAVLGIDVIEAGFPGSNPKDFACVQTIARVVGKVTTENAKVPVIAGLARAVEQDIRAVYEAIRDADHPRIHTFLATSPQHREIKFRGKSKDEIKKMAVDAVRLAKSLVHDVEFSLEDAGRTEIDFMIEVTNAVIDAGATTVNIPDTVGYCIPGEYQEKIAAIFTALGDKIKEKNVVISTHCHNDLGMAVANSLAGVKAGARQVEGTILGVGERAGNAALEQVMMALKTRQDYFGCTTSIDPTKIGETARIVSAMSGIPIHPHAPIIGANAFSHGSGIHQNGMQKGAETYEIMTPESIGWEGHGLYITDQSGEAGIIACIKTAGIGQIDELPKEFRKQIIDAFKDNSTDAIIDQPCIISTVAGVLGINPEPFKLINWQVQDSSSIEAIAFVEIEHDGKISKEVSMSNGTIAASVLSIQKATGSTLEIEDYEVHNEGDTASATAIVDITCKNGHEIKVARCGTDTVGTTIGGYMAAVNAVNVLPKVNELIANIIREQKAAVRL